MTWHALTLKMTAAAALFGLMSVTGCKNCGPGTGDDDDNGVSPPTVEGVPDKTREETISVHGTKAAGQAIWVMLDREDKARTIVEADDQTTWVAPILLPAQGRNQMNFFSEDGQSTFSEPVGPFTVTLDSIAPGKPVVTGGTGAHPLNGATQVTVTLTGTKAADGDLWMSENGGTKVQKAGLDGQTSWTVSLQLSAGSYSYVFTSKDDFGNESEPSDTAEVGVFGDPPPPTLNPVTTPTNIKTQRITGTKTTGTGVVLMAGQNAQDAETDEVASPSTATTWAYTISIPNEGPNTFYLRSKLNGVRSSAISGTIVVDTIAPTCPAVDATEPVVFLDGAASKSLTFTGTKEDGSKLLMGGVEQSSAGTGTTWSVTVPNVPAGTFTAVFDAEDAATNRSTGCLQIRVDVTDVQPPTLDPVEPCVHAATLHLSGTKSGGLYVMLQREGEADRPIHTQNTGTWGYNLTGLVGGENTFCVYTQNPTTNLRSEPVCATVTYMETLLVDAVTSPTKSNEVTFSGNKGAGQWVKMRMNGAEAELVAANDQTSWTAQGPVTLSEGPNAITLWGGMGSLACTSGDVAINVVLDKTAPRPPHFNPTPPAQTGTSTIVVAFDHDPSGDLRLRVGSALPSVKMQASTSDTSAADVHDTLPVELGNGSNTICIHSQDPLGNASAEDCATVVLGRGPTVTIIAPANNGVVQGTQVNVLVSAVAENGSSAVASVNVCLNSHCNAAARVGNTDQYNWSYTIPANSPEFVNNSTHHVVATATNADGISSDATVQFTYNNSITLVSDTAVQSESDSPKVAIDGQGVVNIVWADACIQFGFSMCPESKPGNYPDDIFLRTYNPSTSTMGSILLVSDGDGDASSTEPSIATDKDGNLHVVWVESGSLPGKSGGPDIVHRSINAQTRQMGPIEVLCNTAEEEVTPAISAGSDGTLHVVWDHPNGPSHEIMYTRLDAGAAAWTTPVVVSNRKTQGATQVPDGTSQFPGVAADSAGCGFVVWQNVGTASSSTATDGDIFYRKVCSTSNLGTITLVTDNPLDGDSRTPAVVVDGSGTATFVWQDRGSIGAAGTDGDIWMRRYPAVGAPEQYTLVSRNSERESFSPAVTLVPGGEVLVAWSEDKTTDFMNPKADIYINTSISGGLIAMDGQAVTSTNGPSSQVAIAVDAQSNLRMVWQDLGSVANSGSDTDVFYQGKSLNQ